MVPTSPTRELYVQGSQEHQRLGSNPRTGRLKTDALTTGPRESLTRLRGVVGYESGPEGGAVRCEACCACREAPVHVHGVGTGGGGGWVGCGTVGSPTDVHRGKRRTVAPPDRRLTVGRGVALPLSVPLPSLGRQQSGRHRRCAVHGGRGPPYHSGSCAPGFSGYDLCGVPVRRRGPACSSRPPCGPAAGAGGRVTLRLPSRAGGAHPPCLGGGVAPRPPRSRSGRRPAVPLSGSLRVAGALPSGARVRSGLKCRPGVGGGEGRPVDRSPGGPS